MLDFIRRWKAAWKAETERIDEEMWLIDNCPYHCDNGEIHYLDAYGGVASVPCDHGDPRRAHNREVMP